MAPVDATPGKQSPAKNDGKESEIEAQSTDETNTDKPQKKERGDADVLPDGSGDDARPSHEGHGQESGDQSFDAG